MSADLRPANCRFRLADEGKPYPKSGCEGCGKTIFTGLGVSCQQGAKVGTFNRNQLDDIRASDREAIAKAARAWAVERCGQAFADELAEFIRRGQ